MKRYYIVEARCEESAGGCACGPVGGPVIAEARIKTDQEEFYLTLADVDGYPNFYKTNDSVMEKLLNMDLSDEELEEINEHFVETGLYDEIFSVKDEEWFDLYRYMIYLVRSSSDECAGLIKESVGKYLDQLEVPTTDVEEDYLDME